jgi:acyl carrier protein
VDNQEIIREFIRKEIIRQKNAPSLSDSVSLIETGIIDSLSIQILVAFLEKKFSLHITDDAIIPENFETIEAIADLVRRISNPPV